MNFDKFSKSAPVATNKIIRIMVFVCRCIPADKSGRGLPEGLSCVESLFSVLGLYAG